MSHSGNICDDTSALVCTDGVQKGVCVEWVQTILIFNPHEKRFVSPVSDAQAAVSRKGTLHQKPKRIPIGP